MTRTREGEENTRRAHVRYHVGGVEHEGWVTMTLKDGSRSIEKAGVEGTEFMVHTPEPLVMGPHRRMRMWRRLPYVAADTLMISSTASSAR